MLQPNELKKELPMQVANGTVSSTTGVWAILAAANMGNLEKVRKLVEECPDLIYAQYNYTPPIYFAVREGHTALVDYLLNNGALDPGYKTYPFQETLLTMAQDREYNDIVSMLQEYAANPALHKFKGDNGEIDYKRTDLQQEFEKAVDQEDISKTGQLLAAHPEFALDETYFWGEGILTFAAKENNRGMIDLLMNYGAKVPPVIKWAQFYYFERLDGATYMMEKGMNPNTMSWHRVTLLHDMAQKGDLDKAALLIKHGAGINAVDEEYRSTPLGMAARWGQVEMVEYLLKQGADPNKAGAIWSTPLSWAVKKNHEVIEKILLDAGAT
ncbi:MAG TPA: ankyrin repeat domain-containing protein [Ferruginibacter sp.]|nr:ankyrin repeat domain-containing protein [Ferruginibacter sp.]